MRPLFDANLSPKLVRQLADLFPASTHLFDLPLPRDAADSVIRTYAKQHGLDIVTADSDDYLPMVQRFGPPPKVILLESWRYPTSIALELLRKNAILVAEFAKTDQACSFFGSSLWGLPRKQATIDY